MDRDYLDFLQRMGSSDMSFELAPNEELENEGEDEEDEDE